MNLEATFQNKSDHALKTWGAAAFFAMPLCYIAMFLIYGVALSIPQSVDVSEKIAYAASQQTLLSIANVIGYLVFGCLLLISVQATHSRLVSRPSHLLNFASIFGLIWVVLMMCSGMIALVGINTMATLFEQGSAHAETLFFVYTTVVNGLGGGIELVGGMWVLILSVYGLKTAQISKLLNVLGLIVGLLGIFTLIQTLPELKDAFGLCQILWFIGMGVSLLKSPAGNSQSA